MSDPSGPTAGPTPQPASGPSPASGSAPAEHDPAAWTTSGDPHQPSGQNPVAPDYGQAPYGRAPYGQAPYAGQPGTGATQPYGQAPYGQAPYGQAPYGQAPYGQAPYGQAPYGQSPYGQSPYGQAPYAQQPGAGGAPQPYGPAGSGYGYPTAPAGTGYGYVTAPAGSAAPPRSGLLGLVGLALVTVAMVVDAVLFNRLGQGIGTLLLQMNIDPSSIDQADFQQRLQSSPEFLQFAADNELGARVLMLMLAVGVAGWIISIVATATRRGRPAGIAGILVGIAAPVVILIAGAMGMAFLFQ